MVTTSCASFRVCESRFVLGGLTGDSSVSVEFLIPDVLRSADDEEFSSNIL